MSSTQSSAEFFFDDPRLRMSVAGRLLIRAVIWIAYLVLLGTTFTFLISGILRIRFAGIFLALIILDLFIHRRDGDLPISDLPQAGNVNVAGLLRPVAFSTLERGFDASVIMRRDFFLEMANRLSEIPDIEDALRRLDVPLKNFKAKLDEFADAGKTPSVVTSTPDATATAAYSTLTKDDYLKQAEQLSLAGLAQALGAGHQFIEAGDLFAALATVGDATIGRLFHIFSLDAENIERALIASSWAHTHGLGGSPRALGGFSFETHRRIPHRIMNRAWTSRPTPMLDRYAIDFTDLAREGQIGFLIGHDVEYGRLVETLARPTNPNAILVGDAGIGKEAIVKHLAFRLSKDNVPPALFDKRLVSLELQDLLAGATAEVLSAQLKQVVEEIAAAGNIILYIPGIHDLLKTSDEAHLSAADALMPIIMNNIFPIVGATFPREFKQFIEPRSDFASAFEVIPIKEITEAEAEKILTYEALILEKKSGSTISLGAIKRAVSLAKKYLHTKFLPASAEDLLKAAMTEASRRNEKIVGPETVTAAAETKTNVPIHEATGAEAETLLKLEDIIHQRLVDQEEAVHAVANALREYRSGLARRGGPIASFLFVGPTGVGKTELAKILADIQFGSEKMMTRLDMTEYQDKASYVRLIGSPDGGATGGNGGHGALTDVVLEKPYSLILLDEFEKAHPDILDLFLQVLDDGRLTDGLGRTIDFTNTIIIATSNAHSDIVNAALAQGKSSADVADVLKTRLVDIFKPELINRFSRIIIFKNLGGAELEKIAAANLASVADALREQDIALEFDPSAVAAVARLGYDPAFGARPLRRIIEDKIRAPLSEALLARKITKGARVRVMFEQNGQFSFSPEKTG